jgi:macrolide transport system ATP-binding/permease protein
MTRFLRRLRYCLLHRRMEAELAEEMEFHRTMLHESGAPRAVLGNTTLAREDARAVWIWPWLESLWQDVAYGIRTLRRQPGFTLTALVALGSAIGINTSLFTIFNAFALRPWSVRAPSRVVAAHRFTRDGGGTFAIAEYRYLAKHARTFSGLVAMRNGEKVKMENRALDRPLELTYVSGNYFRVLGVDMERGRGFLEDEDRSGMPRAVAVISHDLWQNRLGADPRIVGGTIRLDDIPFTIVGVTPADFSGTSPLRNDVWAPLPARRLLRPNDPAIQSWLTSPETCCTPVAGRLAPAITRAEAQAELAVLLDQFRAENHLRADRSTILLTGTSWISSPRKKKQVVPLIATLFLAVTLVLLLACANVGNLLLARAAARRQEIAVRLSLGGSRLRVVRQLLVESMVLALLAAGAGLWMAFVVPQAIVHRLAGEAWYGLAPDLNVLLYAIAVAILSCLAFGLTPALHGTRDGIASALKAEVRPARARLPLRSILLSVQVAISVVLLASAGVLARGLQRAQTMDPGFDVQNVTVLSIDLPATQYAGPRATALTADLLGQLTRSRDLPPTGLALYPPLGNATYSTSFQLVDRAGAPTFSIWFNEVSGAYFDALHIPLLAGRNFDFEDTGRNVMMVNESAARRWWPGESPVGKTVFSNGKMREIVGVVADVYHHDLSTSLEPMLYFPIKGALGVPFVLIHGRAAPDIERVSAIVTALEPRAQVHAEPLAANFQRQIEPSIYGAELAGFLGLLALAIASVGMAGVFAYVVGQRTREIGIRMALGAPAPAIVRLVLASSLGALLSGLVVGIAGAAGASTLLAHVLPGMKPLDPFAYGGVVLLLSAAVALASAVPARRAACVDPVRALRWE